MVSASADGLSSPVPPAESESPAAARPAFTPPLAYQKARLNWPSILWIAGLHLGAALALVPSFFHWSALVVFGLLYVATGLGITLGFHRLLTHRSFATNKVVEYVLTVCGTLANEGGPLQWVSTHRRHHTHSDEDDDPHTPSHGFWWSHFGWWMKHDPIDFNSKDDLFNVKDLAKSRFHRFMQRWQVLPPVALALVLFGVGQLVGSLAGIPWLGVTWLVWGWFVRTVFVYHTTWLVNSAAHIWGYRNFETKDRSRNLWWVAALTFGEGWHNNHHAHQRSARHGLQWWEFDITYLTIRLMALVGLARNIHVAPKPNAVPGSRKSVWRILWPRTKAITRRD